MKAWRSYKLFFAVGLSVLLNSAHSAVYVHVRPNVFVTPQSEVKLSQLVRNDGLPPELLAKFESVLVSVAPEEGERQEINDANIMTLIRPLIQKERAQSGKQIQLIVPKSVTLIASRTELRTELIQAELLQAWRPLCSGCQLEITGLNVPRVAPIRDWSLQLKSELPRGSFSIPIQLIREDGKSVSTWVSGRLTVKRKVPVAARILNMNDRVEPADFNWEYRDTSYAIDGIPAAEEITGRKLRQGLRADEILWRNMLERERAVRRGDLVQIRSSSGAWEITANAVAQEDGFVGDTINLKSAKSNTTLIGQITGHGEVDLR